MFATASSQPTDHLFDPRAAAPERKPLSPRRAARREEVILSLANPVVVPEDALQLQTWGMGTYLQFKPVNAWQDWIVQQVALTTFRINRIQRIERRLRDWRALRAIDFWEDDQRLEVETLALNMADEPAHTVSAMLASPAGCDWLIDRWQMLARIEFGSWTDAQRTLARHLGRGVFVEWTPELIANHIIGLENQRERIIEIDTIARTLIEADLCEDLTPAQTRLRRYERTLTTRLKWYTEQLKLTPPERPLYSQFRPEYVTPLIEPVAEATPAPAAPAAAASSMRDDETKPFEPSEAATANDETKPFEPSEAVTANDETKPFEPSEAVTANDETKPFEPSEAVTANDETKPFEPGEPATANDETKPFEPESTPEPVIQSQVKPEPPMTLGDRVEHRKSRINLEKAVAQLRKARRRSA